MLYFALLQPSQPLPFVAVICARYCTLDITYYVSTMINMVWMLCAQQSGSHHLSKNTTSEDSCTADAALRRDDVSASVTTGSAIEVEARGTRSAYIFIEQSWELLAWKWSYLSLIVSHNGKWKYYTIVVRSWQSGHNLCTVCEQYQALNLKQLSNNDEIFSIDLDYSFWNILSSMFW